MKPGIKATILILAVLLVDQASKFWIKTTMFLGQEYEIASWFYIHFTENEGMAFGLTFGTEYGKLILSLFRIIAVVFIGLYLRRLILQKVPMGFVYSIALILAGALGNILDSAFYGLLFSDSQNQVATLFPDGGGYAGFLHGKVVDMLYFPIYHGFLPTWVPFWGGDYFVFFQPVFNLADSSITIGVFMILLFQRKFFTKPSTEAEKAAAEKAAPGEQTEAIVEPAAAQLPTETKQEVPPTTTPATNTPTQPEAPAPNAPTDPEKDENLPQAQ